MHIILDIDNTLIDSLDIISYNRVKDLVKIPDHIGNGMFIWERPYLGNFLNYLDKNIKYISIWTNANKEWLHFILHTVLSKYLKPERFSLLLNIESSTNRDLTTDEIVLKVPVKDISILLDKIGKKELNMSNSVLIDDNYFNCFYNMNNSIPIKKYEILNNKNCKNLLLILEIIDVLRKTDDIPKFLNNVYKGIKNYKKLFSKQFMPI